LFTYPKKWDVRKYWRCRHVYWSYSRFNWRAMYEHCNFKLSL